MLLSNTITHQVASVQKDGDYQQEENPTPLTNFIPYSEILVLILVALVPLLLFKKYRLHHIYFVPPLLLTVAEALAV